MSERGRASGATISRPRAPSPARRYLTGALLAGGVVCAAWYVFVRPLREGLAAANSDLLAMRAQVARGDAGSNLSDDPDTLIEELRDQARAIDRFAGGVGDAQAIYEMYRTLARRHAVKLGRVEPKGSTPLPTRKAGPEVTGELFACSMDATGTYADIAGFMGDCERTMGAAKVTAFRLSPVNRGGKGVSVAGEPLLTANIEVQHLSLGVPREPPGAGGTSASRAAGPAHERSKR